MVQETTTTTKSPQSRLDSILQEESTYETYSEILSQAGLNDADESLLGFYVMRLVNRKLLPSGFVGEITKEFGVKPEVARRIVQAVVEGVLAPLANDLPFSLLELKGRSTVVEPDFSKEEAEVASIAKEKAPIIETKGPLDVPGIVKEICENSAFKFEDATLQERCAKLIESRVRDVRTPEQTRAQLEKAVEQGGFGVSGRRLANMLSMIEGRVLALQGNLDQEEQRKRDEKLGAVPNKADLAKKEESLLTKRYVELTGKVPTEHVAPAAPAVSRTSVAISAHHEQLSREGKIDPSKVKEAIMASRESQMDARPKTTASMQEVRFEKRLSGPIDELRSLTLTDFRRLSKDSMQAATKVKDKAESLEEQGYEKKVEAIAAWRSSPLNQQYVTLTRDAVLTGTSVAEILGKKRLAGEETLTDQELNAIMKLNAELRF